MIPPSPEKDASTGGQDLWAAGYVPFRRSLEGSPLFDDPICAWLLFLLVYRARYQSPGPMVAPGQFRFIDCDIGQAVAGRTKLAKQARCGERRIRTALTRLESWGLVRQETSKQGTLVTLVGYKEFWSQKQGKRPTRERTHVRAPASHGPLTEHWTTGNGEDSSTDQAWDPERESHAPVESVRAHLERARQQFVAVQVRSIQKLWAARPGRDAGFRYIYDGLFRAQDPEEVAEEIHHMLASDLESVEIPRMNESLWSWYSRLTGAWYGAEGDVRFSAEYREQHE